jgi:NADH dehydrogenase/NADH:ubiquinone oxidoreductase subunit G
MSERLTIQIDGTPCECEKGDILFEVARRNDLYIPSLCFHEGLGGLGTCRVCIVEVLDRGRVSVVASCVYPVEREIEVQTTSERIREERGIVLALLCHQAPQDEEIIKLAKQSGVDLPRLKASPQDEVRSDSRSETRVGTCILCGQCAMICERLGTSAIAKVNRGVTKKISTAFDEPAPACVGCKSCASVCPTHTITVTEDDDTRIIWGKSFKLAHCEVCGAPIDTVETLKYVASKTKTPPETLCADHRKKKTADTLASVYSE